MNKETLTSPSPSPSPSNHTRRSKTREISSRFLSPSSSIESGNGISTPSPLHTLSHKSSKQEEKKTSSIHAGLFRSRSSRRNSSTLADHLGNDRLKDLLDTEHNPQPQPQPQLNKQRSCSEFNRFEKHNSKENHRPLFGGSMRYTGKLFNVKTSSSSSTSSNSSSKNSKSSSFLPGRLSVDETSIRRRNSDSFQETMSSESESSSTYLSSTASSRRLAGGVEVSSRYLHDSLSKSRRGIDYDHSSNSNSFGNLPPKNGVKRGNSFTNGYKSTISQWAMSPGRTASPPMSVENKGKPVSSFSSLRPPHSPSRSKGVGNLISLGLDLFKSKKSSSNCSSPVGSGVGENTHQLRMFHNRLIQWRYVNARANAVNATKTLQAERTLLDASESLSKKQSSVVQKRHQFNKEKLEFKLNTVLQSQVEPLEAWADMERQHVSALSTTKDCLHSVVCRVPLIEGVKVDPLTTSAALRHAADLTTSIKMIVADFSPTAQNEGELMKELAEVVRAEKSLLEECFDLVGMLSILETQERSLQCSIVQMKSQQQQQQRQHQSQQQHNIFT